MIESKKFTNPFPGLRPFETDEYRLFFGREGQSDSLISRLQRSHFLAVVGTSGSGKSSLVRAGLLPALRGGMMAGAGSGWRICIMRPGSDPIGNLALALADKDVLLEAGGGLPTAEAEAVIEATLRRGSLGLVEVARQARLAEHEKLLVVVDQFEELFRFRAARAPSSTGDDASAFVKLLLEAAQQTELSIYVVPTMRSDFLGDCSQFQGLPEAINDGQYLIPRMTRDERRFAITGPVGVTRGKITEPLVNRLMNDVGDNPDQLPILQHALMRTWGYWSAHRRNGEPIGLEHYEAVGTMSDALSNHADEAFNELPDERSRLIAELLFKALTERGADNREIRRPTCLKDICEIANASPLEVGAVIDVFRGGGRSFLMPSAGTALTPETVIDISHESLIRNWDRLMGWVKDEADSARVYRRLAGAATDYHQGVGGLLDDVTLQYVLSWRERTKPGWHWGVRYHPEYNTAMAYLESSTLTRDARIEAEQEREQLKLETARAFAEKQARSARRMRWLTAGMAVMFLVSLVIAVWAWRERTNAKESARIAKDSEKTALEEKQRAQTLADKLQRSSDELLNKNQALDKARGDKETEARRADDRATEAVEATKRAEAEKLRAEKKSTEAEAATKLAVANAERGELMRAGLEYLQRDDGRARFAFDNLITSLDEALKSPANQLSREELERLNKELGWAHSNLASAWLVTDDLTNAKVSYQKARAILERVWPKEDRANHPPDPILFETYNGLGHVYHEIALVGPDAINGRSEKIDSKVYFKNAEDLFLDALNFHKALLPEVHMQELAAAKGAVATGYLNLARLYRDMGMTKEAEQNLKDLVELQEQNGYSEDLIEARRELAEFYRNQNSFEDAEQAYNKLIDVQEDISDVEAGYAKRGQDISNSYNELADVYRGLEIKIAKYETETEGDLIYKINTARRYMVGLKAASGAASAIQRLSMKLRRFLSASGRPDSDGKADERDDLADAVADNYVSLGKLDRAAVLYEYARGIREKSAGEDYRSLWKSFDKLTKLYRKYPKPDPKAAEHYELAKKYNLDLINFCKDKPPRSRYAGALMQLGALYAEGPNSTEAESYYKQALDIYARQSDWMNQNVILFRLSKLYEKQPDRVADRERALRDRVDTLATYFSQLATPQGSQPANPVTLVSEYLYAINVLATFYKGLKTDVGNAKAEAAYNQAFVAANAITSKIYSESVLRFYVATLDDYQKLLKLDKQIEVARQVDDVAKGLREKLRQDEERKKQNAQLIQTPAAESTSAPAP